MTVRFSSLLPPLPVGDFLEIRGGPEDGRRIALDAPETWLGASEEATVPLLLDERVEPMHGCVVRLDGGLFVDDGSEGGTFVNERRIQGRAELADGDRLRVGATTMILRRAVAAGAGATVDSARGER